MVLGITQEDVAIYLDETPPAKPRVDSPRHGENIYRPFDSTIGDIQDGYRPYTLIVKAFLDPVQPGYHVFPEWDANGNSTTVGVNVHEMNDSHIRDFKRNAIEDINEAWNGNGRGRLWLSAVDITRGYRDLGSDAIPPPLKCLVDLSWVSSASDAHLRVSVMNTGMSPIPRASCVVGGRPRWSEADMTMHHFQAAERQNNGHYRLTPGGPAPDPVPQQNVFAHEFGHFISLRHSYPAGNSHQAYGHEMNSREMFYYIMGLGMDMLRRAAAPWRRHLVRHGYFPNRTFRPTPVDPVDRQDEKLREYVGWSLQAPPRVRTVRMIRTRTAG